MKSQQTPTCDGCDSRDHETQQREADNAKLRNDSCELVAHGDRFVYASEYEALEAERDLARRQLADTMCDFDQSYAKLGAAHASTLETLRLIAERDPWRTTEKWTDYLAAIRELATDALAKAREAREGGDQ